MPSRNVLKLDIPESYYHVYARGNSRQKIFVNAQDYHQFTNLIARYLSKKPQRDRVGVPYPHLYGKLELLCYCLMPNHFHLLLYQQSEGAMSALMRSLMTSYSRYFNKKYHRSGGLFESRYKASIIDNQAYLEHISRYIHLNPKDWQTSPYSSIGQYLGGKPREEWLRPGRILELFESTAKYQEFVSDYKSHHDMLDTIKYELANDTTPYN